MLRVVLVTAPAKEAESLARKLLKERLVACANLVPKIQSLYWWQGKIEKASETLMILKAPKKNMGRLIKKIASLHPYEVPEVLALPIESGHKPYLEWAEKEAGEIKG